MVPAPEYGPVYNTPYPPTYSRIQDNFITFTPDGPQTLTGITIKYAGYLYKSTPTVTLVGGRRYGRHGALHHDRPRQ